MGKMAENDPPWRAIMVVVGHLARSCEYAGSVSSVLTWDSSQAKETALAELKTAPNSPFSGPVRAVLHPFSMFGKPLLD